MELDRILTAGGNAYPIPSEPFVEFTLPVLTTECFSNNQWER